jgi:hypothetical protein
MSHFLRTRHLSLLVLFTCALAGLPGVPRAAQDATTRPASATGAASASSGDEVLDNAVAAVVVSALTEQFGDEAISVRLDTMDVRVANPRDRLVSGEGRMRVGDDPEWIPFRYRMVYDTTFASAGRPSLDFAGDRAGEREMPNDATLVRQLDDHVVADLDRQFGTRTRLQLDRISTVAIGRRFLRIEAGGVADLGLDGTMPVRIVALYDNARSAWQRIDYDLD